MRLMVADPSGSCLLQFEQGAAEILRMKEQYRLAMGTDLRFPVAQYAHALGLETVSCGDDVVYLVAEVVDAAVGVARKEPGDRRIVPQRFEQFDLGVRQGDEHHGHPVLWLRDRLGDF